MPAISHPRLLDLPERFETSSLVLRPYREGDGAAFFDAVDEHRKDLSQWLGWVDQRRTAGARRAAC